MSKALQPNKHGLVIVTLTKDYGSNVAGEKAGFLPDIARALIDAGAATSFVPAEAQHAIAGELEKREREAGGEKGKVLATDADSRGNPTPDGNDAQDELEQAEVTTRKFKDPRDQDETGKNSSSKPQGGKKGDA